MHTFAHFLDSRIPLVPCRMLERTLVGLYIVFIGLSLTPLLAAADVPEPEARALLATAHRIVVLPPFYGTKTLHEKPPANFKPKQLEERLKYQQILQRLEVHATLWLPERVAHRTPFLAIAGEKVQTQLEKDHLTPRDLFTDNGLIHGDGFPLPRLFLAQQLAQALHADLILLTVLDEPRRVDGHYIYELMGGLEHVPSHVNCRGAFYLVDAQGRTLFHGVYSVNQPLTIIAGHTYLYADWRDAINVLIEDFLDDLYRLLPQGPIASPVPSQSHTRNSAKP